MTIRANGVGRRKEMTMKIAQWFTGATLVLILGPGMAIAQGVSDSLQVFDTLGFSASMSLPETLLAEPAAGGLLM
jgi:hypothetical protein